MALDSSPAPPHLPRPLYVRNRTAAVVSSSLVLLAAVLAVLLAVGGYFLLTQKTIVIDIDGQRVILHTRQVTVGAALDEAGLILAPQDALAPGLLSALQNGMTVEVRRARTVLVEVDGQVITLRTRQTVPAALLAEARVVLGPHDLLRADGQSIDDPTLPLAEPPVYLEVIHAATLTIDDGGSVYTVYTTAPTVGAALDDLGVVLYLADRLDPPPESPVVDGMRITVRRSVPVTITVGGVQVSVRTPGATVGEALTEAGLGLVGEDYSLPPPEAPLPPDGLIRVVRVTEDVLVERAAIPYQTIYRADDTLELDQRRVIQPGVLGVSERRTRIRYEDGLEVSRVEEPARVTLPPVDEIIAYGTRVVIRTLETPDGPLEYWRVIRMLATSYSAAGNQKPPDSPAYGITGTGIPLERGIVAIDPDVIPYFTRLYIPGYGFGLAADSGGAVNGRRIDLGYSDDDLELWYGWVDVYLLAPAPEPEAINYLLP